MKRPVEFMLCFYQRWISPALPPACRYTPTCSEYAREAVERYGIVRGLGMALWRLLRCHPLAKGGYDPVTGCNTHATGNVESPRQRAKDGSPWRKPWVFAQRMEEPLKGGKNALRRSERLLTPRSGAGISLCGCSHGFRRGLPSCARFAGYGPAIRQMQTLQGTALICTLI